MDASIKLNFGFSRLSQSTLLLPDHLSFWEFLFGATFAVFLYVFHPLISPSQSEFSSWLTVDDVCACDVHEHAKLIYIPYSAVFRLVHFEMNIFHFQTSQVTLPELQCWIMGRTFFFCRAFWPHTEVDLWPFEYENVKTSSFILFDICVRFSSNLNYHLNFWALAQIVFFKVIVNLTLDL